MVDINFNNTFYVTPHFKYIISIYNQYKKLHDILVFFVLLSLLNSACILHNSTSQCGLATLQVLSSHMWPLATVWDSATKPFISCKILNAVKEYTK